MTICAFFWGTGCSSRGLTVGLASLAWPSSPASSSSEDEDEEEQEDEESEDEEDEADEEVLDFWGSGIFS